MRWRGECGEKGSVETGDSEEREEGVSGMK